MNTEEDNRRMLQMEEWVFSQRLRLLEQKHSLVNRQVYY
jgi:hypothetical protein